MENVNLIYTKLENFIKKYYTNELIRGSLVFLGLGLLYFIFTVFIEYFLWLKPVFRTFLFWIFILIELFLLFRFILFPLFKLFKLQKGINYVDASKIIGTHFSEVGDRLLNFLQLSNTSEKSELLLASIDQKANALQPVPFSNAINLSKNKKYLPLAILPLLFLLFFYVSDNGNRLASSIDRVVHYNNFYTPPAPFEIFVLNKDLKTEQGKDFVLQIATKGTAIPDNATIFIDNESYFMEKNESGNFIFRFEKPYSSQEFYIQANTVRSKNYNLQVYAVPSISNIQMTINYPSYTHRKSEIISGTGNAIVPEGSSVSWTINTVATDNISFVNNNFYSNFNKNSNLFTLSKKITQNIDYQIITSNQKVKDYEKLAYKISTIKDQFPSIDVNNVPESVSTNTNYVVGSITDDYGFSKLNIVYYPKDNPTNIKRGTIPIRGTTVDKFIFTFPSNLPVVEGTSYEYYFEVFDNDSFNNFKSTKSSVFSNKILSQEQKQDLLFDQQNANINGLSKSLKTQDKQLNELDKLSKTSKEKESLDFKDQQKISDFIKRQEKQDEMMKDFAKKMKENLEKLDPKKKDELQKELEKRLENQQKELEKNQKLLDELKELNKKISPEEIAEKLDKLKQTSKNQVKNLEQMVELTKKFYVEKKAEQVIDKLEKLAEKQEKLSEDTNNTKDKQDELNKEFKDIQKDLDELDKENKELKSPIDLPNDSEKEKSIEEDQKDASKELDKKQKQNAKQKQKNASKKMKEMSKKMEESMEQDSEDQLEEDIETLRQILDNLLAFSFSEEKLLNNFKNLNRNSPSFNKYLKKQQDLKLQFKHIDDSLYALGTRQPKITDLINTEVGNVHYNITKSIENLVEANVSKGTYHQQYTVSSSNKLADMLSESLNNMQNQSQSGSGKGKPKKGKGDGEGFQLPDIIKKQGELSEKVKQGMKKGSKPGEQQSDGKEGKDGKESQNGKEGKQGKDGKEGKGEKEGQNGKDGKGKQGKEGNGSSGNGGSQNGQSGKDGKNGDSKSDKNGKSGKEGQSGKDGKDGEKGEFKNNDGNSDGEGDAEELFKIYKEQKDLRENLQRELEKKGLGSAGQNALNQMKDIEKQLVNKGFKNEVLQKILNVKQELLKLDTAMKEQGEEQKRQAESSKKQFSNTTNQLPKEVLNYINSIEILNRDNLPVNTTYDKKIKNYFKPQ